MNINQVNDSQISENDCTTVHAPVITNDTSFGDLLKILSKYPEAMESAQLEARMRRNEEKLDRIREILGEDAEYEIRVVARRLSAEAAKEGVKCRRPSATKLRETCVLLTHFQIGEEAKIEVYSNAYAIYDNGDRKGVLWIPGCGRVVYQFTRLRENEKLYMSEHADVSEEITTRLPWYQVLTIAGENRIEFNLAREKSKSNSSDLTDEQEYEIQVSQRWNGCARFENPEEAYLRKETREEHLAMLTERQREIYEMYFDHGYERLEIAQILGIDRRSVGYHLEGITKHLKKYNKKFF